METRLQKIVIDLAAGDPATAETVFGYRVRPGAYQIKNVPVWAYGIAFEDVVEASKGDDGRFHFVRVIEKSGLLTVRAAGPHANGAIFAELVNVLKANAVVTENYSATYSTFAMDLQGFAKAEPAIIEAERSSNIYVEIANDNP